MIQCSQNRPLFSLSGCGPPRFSFAGRARCRHDVAELSPGAEKLSICDALYQLLGSLVRAEPLRTGLPPVGQGLVSLGQGERFQSATLSPDGRVQLGSLWAEGDQLGDGTNQLSLQGSRNFFVRDENGLALVERSHESLGFSRVLLAPPGAELATDPGSAPTVLMERGRIVGLVAARSSTTRAA